MLAELSQKSKANTTSATGCQSKVLYQIATEKANYKDLFANQSWYDDAEPKLSFLFKVSQTFKLIDVASLTIF